MNATQTEAIIPLWQAERDVLGLPLDAGDFTMSQAGELVRLARESRSAYLGGIELTSHKRPGDFYRMYGLTFEQRIGAALTTSIIERVTTKALGAAAAELTLGYEPAA